jgi:hypothetical protein
MASPTKFKQPALDRSADSPIKDMELTRKETWFSHFTNRQFTQLSTDPIVSAKFSKDSSLLATSF